MMKQLPTSKWRKKRKQKDSKEAKVNPETTSREGKIKDTISRIMNLPNRSKKKLA